MNIGHNSSAGGESFGHAQLKSIVERIERLEAEKKAIAADIKEVYSEAKSHGLNPAIIREAIKFRAADAEKRAEKESLLEVYLKALGAYVETPLGQAALAKAGV
jgi:uncharacterized protein (UPF0335 family)